MKRISTKKKIFYIKKNFYIEQKQSFNLLKKYILLSLLLFIIMVTIILSNRYPEVKYLIAFIFVLPIIKNTINCISTIHRYLSLHSYFPLSHAEIYNNILNIKDYEDFIKSMFKFRPFPKTMNAIKETASREFKCYSFDIEFESLLLYIIENLGIIFLYLSGLSMFYQKNYLIAFIGIIFFLITIYIINLVKRK